jgi:hypothetical protein
MLVYLTSLFCLQTIYPGVDIELVLSVGTGVYLGQPSKINSLGWTSIVNQLIGSSTDTEHTHRTLSHILPQNTVYHRLNTIIPNNTAIDERDKDILEQLKQLGRESVRNSFEVSSSKATARGLLGGLWRSARRDRGSSSGITGSEGDIARVIKVLRGEKC